MTSDMLSTMPEDIISNILSRMPTKHAVRTSVLSKRWRYNWTYVNNLDFDDRHPRTRRVKSLTQFVNRALKLCKASQLNLFRLRFVYVSVRRTTVSKWINEAIKLNVKELDIHVGNIALPLSMLTSKTLTTLRIHIIPNDSYNWEFPCAVDLPCLKTLDIVVRSKPLAGAYKLVSGCPMLENLSLDVINGVKEDEVYRFNIATLKRLEITWGNTSQFTNNFVLNVPNLEYLCVRGSLSLIFVMENVSSLVEASISLSNIKSHRVWVELLKGLSKVKSLTVEFLGLSIDFKTLFASPLPVFPKMKHLELKEFWRMALIPHFLESSPGLKHLCIGRVVDRFYKRPKECIWVEPKLVPACMLTELTTVKFSACEWWESDLPFLKYMLGNAEALKTVEITREKLHIKKKMQLYEKLLKFSRASSCEIHFHGELLHEAEKDDGSEDAKNEQTKQEVVESLMKALDDFGKQIDGAVSRFGDNETLQSIKKKWDSFRGV